MAEVEKEVAETKSEPTSHEVSGPMIFEEVAGDPACRLDAPGDTTKGVPGGPKRPQEALPGHERVAGP